VTARGVAHSVSRQPPSGRGLKKGRLPTKTCVTCARPFEWRKKWAEVWDEVRYCSERCRRHRNDAQRV
jgi:hypothetical protein